METNERGAYLQSSGWCPRHFHSLLVLLVGLGGLLSELLILEGTEVPDRASSLALHDYLLENLCEKKGFKIGIRKDIKTKCQPVFCWVTNIIALQR